jgi:hypothetical protein
MHPKILVLLGVFVAAVTFLRSRCLATICGHTQRGIYEIHRLVWLRCHDIDTKFHIQKRRQNQAVSRRLLIAAARVQTQV